MKIKIICDNYKETSHVMMDALLRETKKHNVSQRKRDITDHTAPNINQWAKNAGKFSSTEHMITKKETKIWTHQTLSAQYWWH